MAHESLFTRGSELHNYIVEKKNYNLSLLLLGDVCRVARKKA